MKQNHVLMLAGNMAFAGLFSLAACHNQSGNKQTRQDTADSNTNRPNIIFIYADDLDFDQMEVDCYPHNQYPCFTGAKEAGKLPDHFLPEGWDPVYFEDSLYTPNMDKLSKQGAYFSRFYITSAMSTPSRYSLLTGKYAHKSQSLLEEYPAGTVADIEWNQYLNDKNDNLAKQLKKAGYYTAIVGKWHNGEPEAALTKDVYNTYKHDSLLLQQKMQEAQQLGCQFLMDEIGFDYATHMSFSNADRAGGHNLPWYTDAVVDFLAQDHEKPFFLYFPLPVPHGFGGGSEFKHDLLLSPAGYLSELPTSQPSIDDVYRRIRENGCSDRSITFTWIDDCLGAVMQKLEDEGLAENTILIFTSDHQSRGKFSCYEGAHVPFMIRWPGVVKPGSHVDDIWANIDIMPTLLEIAAASIPDGLDGQSFLGRLTGETAANPDRALLLETNYGKAVVKGDYKYIANRPPSEVIELMKADSAAVGNNHDRTVGWDGHQSEHNSSRGLRGVRFTNNQFFKHYFDADQLYNLSEDVFEQSNLAAEQPDKLAEMQEELKKLLTDCPHSFGEFK